MGSQPPLLRYWGAVGVALVTFSGIVGCAAPRTAVMPQVTELAVEDRIVFESTCGPWTDCAGWRVEAWPSGELRMEGIDGVAQRGVFTATTDASKWREATALLQAFDWAAFERSSIQPRPIDCATRSFQFLVRWEQLGAPPKEIVVEQYCA